LNQILSPDRNDAFAAGEKTPDPSVRTYAEIMREEALKREKEETLRAISKKKKEEEENAKAAPEKSQSQSQQVNQQKRRNRWDQSQDEGGAKKAKTSDWDAPESATTPGRWDATPTPGRVIDATPGRRNVG
jgi:splicing factor 3B subunit 1